MPQARKESKDNESNEIGYGPADPGEVREVEFEKAPVQEEVERAKQEQEEK